MDHLDRFSFEVKKKTAVVLDNASVHRNWKVKEMRKIWEDRGLFLFDLPPYSLKLNPAETLWRILKGKWIRPADYNTKDSLFYCTYKALCRYELICELLIYVKLILNSYLSLNFILCNVTTT